VLEAMSEAVEKANIFLMLYSSDYKASANCRAGALDYILHNCKIIDIATQCTCKNHATAN